MNIVGMEACCCICYKRAGLSSANPVVVEFDPRFIPVLYLLQLSPVSITCPVANNPRHIPAVPPLLFRGGRIELRYHKDCFSNIADPRSQPASSANVGKFAQSLRGTVAPEELYRKMRTRGHW